MRNSGPCFPRSQRSSGVLLTSTVVVFASAFAATGSRPSPETAPSAANAATGFKTEGVGSCAAVACHGGDPAAGEKGAAYAAWKITDPHAAAGKVLGEERSRKIAEILRRSGLFGKSETPAESETCLKCHGSLQQTANWPRHWEGSEGVACEMCHGPAEGYLEKHFRPEWRALDATGKARYGMADTKNLLVRARTCMPCHVGAPGQEVGHDLIAAGHPMLRFEFAAYLSQYQKTNHWNVERDRASRVRHADRRPSFELEAWAIGLSVLGRTEAKLVSERAAGGTRQWPEVAEFDCIACHHSLRSDSIKPADASFYPPGRPRWGAWYFDLLDDLSSAESVKSPFAESLHGLRAEMDKAGPRRPAARLLSGRIVDQLSETALVDSLARSDLFQLFKKLATARRTEAWEGARQRFLGATAVLEAARERNAISGENVWSRSQAVVSALKRVDFLTRLWQEYDPVATAEAWSALRTTLNSL